LQAEVNFCSFGFAKGGIASWLSARMKLSFAKLELSPGLAALLGTGPVRWGFTPATLEETMGGLIYLIGLIVVILAVLSFFGLR
jgi:hypothetical protein